MKPALALLALGLAALAFLASTAYAQTEPIELTEVDPPDGARLEQPPTLVHLCFSVPIKDDFRFGIRLPDGRTSAVSFVFQPGGQCVDAIPLLPDDAPAGEYSFDWRASAAEGDEQVSGTLSFRVTERGPAATPSPAAAATPSPAAGATPPPTTPPAGGTTAGSGADGDGPDILLTALVTTASVGGAAVLLTLGYLLRRRIGYEPHRPPEDEEEDESR